MSSSQQPAAASPAAAEPAAAKRRFDMTMWNSTVTRIFLCVDVVLIVLVVAEALVMRNCSKELHGYRKALGIDEHGEEDGEEHDEHAVGRDPGAPHHTAHDDMIEMYPAWFTYVFPWVPVLLALLCMALYAVRAPKHRAPARVRSRPRAPGVTCHGLSRRLRHATPRAATPRGADLPAQAARAARAPPRWV